MDVRRAAGWVLIAVMVPLEIVIFVGTSTALFAANGVFTLASVLSFVAGLLFLSVVPVALFMIALRLVRPRTLLADGGSTARHPVPVAALDEPAIDQVELLAQLEGPVSACPECGFLGVRAPGVRDGLWPGGGETGARFVCPRCQYQGIPIEFDSGDDYAQWVRELHGEAPA